ncbi:MAG: Arc family DNA-binding protein [Janthinobacterium lividum]
MASETSLARKPARTGEQFVIRMPEGMRAEIRQRSTENRRSMNAEMVVLLESGLKKQLGSTQQ